MPVQLKDRDIAILDSISGWNSRVFLISGVVDHIHYPSGAMVHDVIPRGQLVCLFPWVGDNITQGIVPGLTSWAWSSTLTIPTMVWNSSEIVVLNSPQAINHARLRRIQLGIESQYFTAWMMTQFQPQPLYSDRQFNSVRLSTP